MKRYNIWNKIFHSSEVNKNIEDYKLQQSLVNNYECWLTKIGNANTLIECMTLHKYIWRQGFKNTNLGPDKYGMFRTKDINFMTTNEVYIGGFNGLKILTIEEWEECKKELYDSKYFKNTIAIDIVKAKRNINSDGNKRGEIDEVFYRGRVVVL